MASFGEGRNKAEHIDAKQRPRRESESLILTSLLDNEGEGAEEGDAVGGLSNWQRDQIGKSLLRSTSAPPQMKFSVTEPQPAPETTNTNVSGDFILINGERARWC